MGVTFKSALLNLNFHLQIAVDSSDFPRLGLFLLHKCWSKTHMMCSELLE
jgi:hypothetical protein